LGSRNYSGFQPLPVRSICIEEGKKRWKNSGSRSKPKKKLRKIRENCESTWRKENVG